MLVKGSGSGCCSRSLIQNLGLLLACSWFSTLLIIPTNGLDISSTTTRDLRGVDQVGANDVTEYHHHHHHHHHRTKTLHDAIEILVAHGVPRENLCTTSATTPMAPVVGDESDVEPGFALLPCPPSTGTQQSLPESIHFPQSFMKEHVPPLPTPTYFSQSWIRSRRQRYLSSSPSTAVKIENSRKTAASNEEGGNDQQQEGEENEWFYIIHGLGAMCCVVIAALAAGLTMGLLSLDPLLLLIKIRAGSTPLEQSQAAALLPIVKQHHLLLVTLLLLNSIANEALPLFLEVLVSPLVAVIVSVTLVLFFGEIIPSAIFTGPNKVAIAAQLVPVVRIVMIVLWPLAFPIAKLLDHVLAHEEDNGDMFGRGELSALVRIQYEERMAHKQRRKQEKMQLRHSQRPHHPAHPTTTSTTSVMDLGDNTVGALDFASLQLIKASKKSVERRYQNNATNNPSSTVAGSVHSTTSQSGSKPPAHGNHRRHRSATDSHFGENNYGVLEEDEDDDNSIITRGTSSRSESIHLDEVSMVEGALSMKTKMALDVYTPLHRLIAIPHDMILTEQNMVDIYSTGFSRIPVFTPNPQKPKSIANICGLLMTKQLIVVNPNENRPLSTLPLASPQCVSPKMNLVDLLNLFQTGKLGHLALVCARPEVGQDAMYQGKALPEAAGLMGIITLEDVLEALLQEQIYDESDKVEREANRVAKWAVKKWRSHVRRRKRARAVTGGGGTEGVLSLMSRPFSMGTVVEQVMMESHETTRLLPDESTSEANGNVHHPHQHDHHHHHHGLLHFWHGLFRQG